MSSSSKKSTTKLEKSSYLNLFDLDYKDIQDDFYHLVDNDLLMQVVKSKGKKSCPSDVEYIVISDSEDQESPKSCKADNAALTNENLKFENTNSQVIPAKISSPLLSKSISNENIEKKSTAFNKDVQTLTSSNATSPLPRKSLSDEKIYEKNSDTGQIEQHVAPTVKKSLFSEKTANSQTDTANVPNNGKIVDDNDEDDCPVSRVVDHVRSSDNESDTEEINFKLIKKEWCICPNSQNKENLKTCDSCGQWFHIMCAADTATIKKVQSGIKVSLIEDFKCLLCRNDREAMKKFDPEKMEERIKLRNERLSLSDSGDETINRIRLAKETSPEQQVTSKLSSKNNLNEKKELVKQRTIEQKKTKLLTDNRSSSSTKKYKSHQASKVMTPKQINHKTTSTEIKKTFNQTSKLNSPTVPNRLFMTKSTTPKQSNEVLRATKVISDRDKTTFLLIKSLKERVDNTEDLNMSDQHIESLCNQIEQEIYKKFGQSHEYNNLIKTIRINVNDKSNRTFYRKILTGAIKPEQLPLMDRNDMKDDELRRQDEEFLRQDIKGRIEQSNELNEDIRKKQEAMRERKGIDDDLSTLGTFMTTNDLGLSTIEQNNKPKPIEAPVNEPFEESTGTSPVLNTKKRKHDSDFESDSEILPQVKINKLANEPLLEISLPNIPISTKPEFKISSDIAWSGTLNLVASDINVKFKVHMISVNDFSPSSNRLKLLEVFKQRVSLNAITEFKLIDGPYVNAWNLNLRSFLAFKFEPNMNEKSLLLPQYMTSLKEYKSDEVMTAVYNKVKSSSYSYSAQLPESLQDVFEKIMICPLRKSQKESGHEFDPTLKTKHGILIKRPSDAVLGFLVPRIRKESENKKSSPSQSKQNSGKDEVRDPRMRKAHRTSPVQEQGQNGSSDLKEKATEDGKKKICHPRVNENASGRQDSNHVHKTISLDAYKQKHKLGTDSIDSVPMDIESPKSPAYSENFKLIDKILGYIGPETTESNRRDILENMSKMSFLKSMDQQEIDELKQKYEHVPEFSNSLLKAVHNDKVCQKEPRLDKDENLPATDEQNSEKNMQKMPLPPKDKWQGSSKESVENLPATDEQNSEKNMQKMPLPPKDKWQGSSKESFENLLRLHKAAKERQSNGLSHDLTLENRNWKLDENIFRQLDESLIGKISVNNNVDKVRSSNSETNVSSDEVSGGEKLGPVKKIKCTARKSVSGLVKRFKVKE